MNAVITGGSKGIGRSVAKLFAANGFNIAVCSRNMNNLEALKADILKESPDVEILIYSCDMSVKQEVKDFAAFIKNKWTEVHVLINNAGTFVGGTIMEENEEVLESQINTNLYSAYFMSRGLSSIIKEDGTGHIFNLCSVASLGAYPNGGSYTISKFAMLGFSKTLREELKERDIRVTSIMPGAVLTDSWTGTQLPEERFMPPEDIAKMIYDIYCLSPRTVVEDIVVRPMKGDI